MTFLQFKKIARWSGLRAALLGAMGLVTLLFPEFLQGGIIYVVAAYAILNGALLLIESVVYFIAALCAKSKLKALLVILSLLVACGGITLVIFTFGFGDLPPLAKILSSLLFLSCITELLIGLTYKNINDNGGTV